MELFTTAERYSAKAIQSAELVENTADAVPRSARSWFGRGDAIHLAITVGDATIGSRRSGRVSGAGAARRWRHDHCGDAVVAPASSRGRWRRREASSITQPLAGGRLSSPSARGSARRKGEASAGAVLACPAKSEVSFLDSSSRGTRAGRRRSWCSRFARLWASSARAAAGDEVDRG